MTMGILSLDEEILKDPPSIPVSKNYWWIEEPQWRRVINESDINLAGEKGAGFLYFYKTSAESVFVNDKTNVTEIPEVGKPQRRIRGYKLGCINKIHFINILVLFFGHL